MALLSLALVLVGCAPAQPGTVAPESSPGGPPGHIEDLDNIFRERFPLDPAACTAIQVYSRGEQQDQLSLVVVKAD